MDIIEDNKNQTPEEFYASLKTKLEEQHNFPEEYLFKFILPNDQKKIMQVYKIFDDTKNTITNRDSKNSKYTSLNISAFMMDAAQVIQKYQEAGKIESIMML